MNYERLVLSPFVASRVGVRRQRHIVDIPADTHVAQSAIEKREPPMITRGSKFLMLAASLLAATACGSGSPTAATPTTPLCQTNHTAEVNFSNPSVNAWEVRFDNVTRIILAPGQVSPMYTESAGVQHITFFRFPNNNSTMACAGIVSVFAQCSSQTLTCKN